MGEGTTFVLSNSGLYEPHQPTDPSERLLMIGSVNTAGPGRVLAGAEKRKEAGGSTGAMVARTMGERLDGARRWVAERPSRAAAAPGLSL